MNGSAVNLSRISFDAVCAMKLVVLVHIGSKPQYIVVEDDGTGSVILWCQFIEKVSCYALRI